MNEWNLKRKGKEADFPTEFLSKSKINVVSTLMDYIIAKLIEYINTLTPLPLWKYYCHFLQSDKFLFLK